MSNLPVSKYRALDANGDPIAGAKLYTYEGGTTTANPTYSTRAGAILDDGSTNVNANPVVADSNGYFGEIYLTPDEAYKLILKDADDNTLWTDDDVYAVQLSNAENTTRIKQGFASPLDYPEGGVDAVGDGSADEYAQVQNAIDASTGVVDLLGKTFRCDSALTLKSGLTLRNGTLDFSQCAANSYISAAGSWGGAPNGLTGDASRGDLTLDVADDSGLAADDWLILTSDATWDGADTTGEIVQIDAVASDTVTLKSGIHGNYTAVDNAKVEKITTLENITLENVKITMSPSAPGTGIGLHLYCCVGVRIRGCRFHGAKAKCIRALTSVGIWVEDCEFEDGGSSASAIEFYSAAQDVRFRDNYVRRLPYGVYNKALATLVSRHICVEGNSFDGVAVPVYLLGACELGLIKNNICNCDQTGANAAGGISIKSPGFEIAGNVVRESGGHGITADLSAITSTDPVLACSVRDNRIYACDDDGIYIKDAVGAVISGNHVESSGSEGVVVDTCTGLDVSGNYVVSPGAGGILLDDIRYLDCRGNRVVTPTTYGISVITSLRTGYQVAVSQNHVRAPGTDGIVVTGASVISGTTITGNTVLEVDGAGDHCLHVTGEIYGMVISGNAFFRDDDLDDNIQTEGSGAAAINGVVVTGNYLDSGDYGLGEPTDANTTNVVFEGNMTLGMGTGASEGTVTAGNLNN